MHLDLLVKIAVVIAIVIIIAFTLSDASKKQNTEGMTRYYMPYTRSQFGTTTGAPLFYSPVLMKQTNRCGDYGFNY